MNLNRNCWAAPLNYFQESVFSSCGWPFLGLCGVNIQLLWSWCLIHKSEYKTSICYPSVCFPLCQTVWWGKRHASHVPQLHTAEFKSVDQQSKQVSLQAGLKWGQISNYMQVKRQWVQSLGAAAANERSPSCLYRNLGTSSSISTRGLCLGGG